MLFGLLALVLTACVALVLIVRFTLAPAADEWSARVALGPVGFDASVPSLIRLVTSEWFAPQLDGHSIDTRYGTVHFAWRPGANALELRCAPCSATVPALGAQPVRVDQLTATLRRDGNALDGALDAVPVSGSDAALHGRWDAGLTSRALRLDIDLQEAPIALWYAMLAPTLPELQRARIGGTLAMHGRVTLPAGTLVLQPPRVRQFTVEGLDTEAMIGARGDCGAPSRLGKDSWLARAVVAAEDPRFFTRSGDDPAELAAAIDGNPKTGQTGRSGGTLTQQLARRRVTGSDRPVERQLRELLYAVDMEQTLGKARILQLYLDTAPWGDGLCGAEAAARHYFKRSALRLEPAQAVWLAAMLDNPQAAAETWRRDGGIDAARVRWVAEGVRGITRPQREALLRSVAAAKFAPP